VDRLGAALYCVRANLGQSGRVFFKRLQSNEKPKTGLILLPAMAEEKSANEKKAEEMTAEERRNARGGADETMLDA
jgi:hypothetical protein